MRKSRRVLRAALYTLGALAIAAIGVAVWQRENIGAYITSRRYTPAQLKEQIEEQEASAEKILSELPEAAVRDLTDEEKEKLRSGEVSEEEAAALLVAPADGGGSGKSEEEAAAAGGETVAEGDEAVAGGDEAAAQARGRVSELIAEIYVLRASMTARLEGIAEAAIAEYESQPAGERTQARKRELAARCLSEAASLESECDARMENIVKELETQLRETGGDAGVAEEIRQAYKAEKSLKKSYILSQY
jgi:hypothetical protein